MVNLWPLRREIRLEKEKLIGILTRKELGVTIENNGYDVEELLKNREFDTLNKLFDKYYSIQLSHYSKRFNLMIEIDETLQKIAIANKIQQGQFYTGDTILTIIEKNKGLNDSLKELKEICEYCRKLSIAIFDNYDEETVRDLLNKIPQGYENLVDVFKATLWLKLKTASSTEDYESIINEGTEFLKLYPEDGELMGFVWRKAKENVGIDRMAEEEIYVD